MKNRAATDPMDRNAVNKVRVASRISGAHASSEKAKGVRREIGISQPTDISSDAARSFHWQQCYGDLWKLKLALDKQYNR